MKKLLSFMESTQTALSRKKASVQKSQFEGNFPSLNPPTQLQLEPQSHPQRHSKTNQLVPKGSTQKSAMAVAEPQTPVLQPNPKSPFVFNDPDLAKAKSRFDAIISRYHDLPAFRVCNAVLKSFSTISTLPSSVSLLKHMTRTVATFSPDHATFHILLSQCCKSPNTTPSHVRRILDLMAARGCPPQPSTLNVAVWSLCFAERVDDAADLVKDFCLKHGMIPDIRVYNFVVKRLCKSRSVGTIHNFITQMREAFKIEPDLVTYQILIHNVANSQDLRQATRLLGLLSDCGFKMNSYIYNVLMKGCCKVHECGHVADVYTKMQEEGIEPDIVTYNTLIFGLSNVGRIKDGRVFLDSMTEKGYQPDAAAYTSLVKAYCRLRDPLGALALVEEMKKKGCNPYECTYNALLNGLCKWRLLDRGMKLYGDMKLGGIKLETLSYAILVRRLCRDGRVAEAYEVFDYAIESKSLKVVMAYLVLESTLKWLGRDRERGIAK